MSDSDGGADTYQRVIGGLRWIALSRVLAQGSAWLITLVTVRLLTPFDYGIMAMSGVLTMFAGLLIDGGLGPVLVQRKDITEDVMRSANGGLLLIAGGAVLAVQLVALPAALFFREPQLELLLRVAALQFPIGALTIVPASMLASRMNFRAQAITHVVSGLAQGLLTIGLAVTGYGYWALAYGALFGALVSTVMLNAYANTPLLPSMRFGVLRPYLRFARYTMGDRFLYYFVQQTDSMIVGRLLGTHQLGSFAVAKQISHLPLDKIGDIASQVTLPAFSRIQNDKAAVAEGVRRLVQFGAVISFPIFWGLMAIAPVAVPTLLGPGWGHTTLPIVAFCSMLPIRTTWTLLARVVVGVGRPEVSFRNQLLWPFIVLPSLIIGAHWGVPGVAIAWALSFPVMFAVSTRRIAAVLSMTWSALLVPLVRPATAAGAMAALVWIIDTSIASQLPNFARLMIGTGAGAATYVLALRLISPTIFRETVEFVFRFVGRNTPRYLQ